MTRVESAQADSAGDAKLRPARPHDPGTRRAVVALAAVSVAYVLAQLAIFTLARALSWDEVVYLAQTAPGEPGMDWGPQRARGIVWLMAPVAVFHPPTEVIRLYLVVVSGLGLFAGFWPWLRVMGPTAAAAAFVFSFSWIGLYFGMEVFPNLPAALAIVATAGFMTDFALTGRRRALVGMAIGIALVAVFRPPDSVWLAAALFIAASAVAWRRIVPMGLALAAGGLAGWAPWLLEMSWRYGSPLQAIAAAKAESASGLPRNDLHQYLNLVEGPVRLLVTDPTLTYRALAALLIVGALITAGLAHRRLRIPAFIATAGMAGGLVPYIVLHTGVNLRYLLPAWGLASIAVAIGASAMVAGVSRAAGRRSGAAAVAAAVVLGSLWGFANSRVAVRNAEVAVPTQAIMYRVAEEVTEHADGRPCAFVTEYGFPQITWATSCIGLEMDVYGETGQCPMATHSLADLAEEGYTVFALARSKLPDDLMVSEWESRQLPVATYGRKWRLLTPTEQQVDQGLLPRAPREGEASVPCPLSRAPTADEIQPLRIGPRLPDDSTIRFMQRRQDLAEEIR